MLRKLDRPSFTLGCAATVERRYGPRRRGGRRWLVITPPRLVTRWQKLHRGEKSAEVGIQLTFGYIVLICYSRSPKMGQMQKDDDTIF